MKLHTYVSRFLSLNSELATRPQNACLEIWFVPTLASNIRCLIWHRLCRMNSFKTVYETTENEFPGPSTSLQCVIHCIIWKFDKDNFVDAWSHTGRPTVKMLQKKNKINTEEDKTHTDHVIPLCSIEYLYRAHSVKCTQSHIPIKSLFNANLSNLTMNADFFSVTSF